MGEYIKSVGVVFRGGRMWKEEEKEGEEREERVKGKRGGRG